MYNDTHAHDTVAWPAFKLLARVSVSFSCFSLFFVCFFGSTDWNGQVQNVVWLFQAITCPFSSHLRTIAQYVFIHAQADIRARTQNCCYSYGSNFAFAIDTVWQVDKLYTLSKTTTIIAPHTQMEKGSDEQQENQKRTGKINTKCKIIIFTKKWDRCRVY